MTVLNTKKLEELLVFIARHPGVQDLGMTKLWKLVYFIDTQALRDLGEPVTGLSPACRNWPALTG